MSGGYGYRAPSPGPLFDPPVSRTSDPSTSHEAEAKLRASGALNGQRADALRRLREYIASHGEPPTTAELAGGDPALVHLLGRRLSDLRHESRVCNPSKRTCRQNGNKAMTWEPV